MRADNSALNHSLSAPVISKFVLVSASHTSDPTSNSASEIQEKQLIYKNKTSFKTVLTTNNNQHTEHYLEGQKMLLLW